MAERLSGPSPESGGRTGAQQVDDDQDVEDQRQAVGHAVGKVVTGGLKVGCWTQETKTPRALSPVRTIVPIRARRCRVRHPKPPAMMPAAKTRSAAGQTPAPSRRPRIASAECRAPLATSSRAITVTPRGRLAGARAPPAAESPRTAESLFGRREAGAGCSCGQPTSGAHDRRAMVTVQSRPAAERRERGCLGGVRSPRLLSRHRLTSPPRE
jgi:hypothetical protein